MLYVTNFHKNVMHQRATSVGRGFFTRLEYTSLEEHIPLYPLWRRLLFIYLCRFCLRNIAIFWLSPQDAVFHPCLFLIPMVHATTHSWSMLLLIIFLLTQTRCSCVNIRIGDNICCFAEVLHVLSIIGIWMFFTQNVPLWSPSYFIATTSVAALEKVKEISKNRQIS